MPELWINTKGGRTESRALAGRPLTLGRAADNDLSYPDDSVLSRRHLSVESDGERWYVLDLGSKNGTLLNGEKLTGRQALSAGDTIEAGGVRLVYSEGLAPAGQTVIFTPQKADDQLGQTSVHVSLRQAMVTGGLESVLATPATGGVSRFQVLLDAGRELAGHSPLSELFGRILDMALGAVGAERGVLLTIENGELAMRAARGAEFRISSSVRDRVVENRESLIVVDVNQDEALRSSATIVSGGVRSLMAVPLQTEEKVIGMLYLDSSNFVRMFRQEDLILVTLLANIAAIRIEHARLIELAQAEKINQNELRQAAEIQTGLLPKSAPHLEGWDIAGFSIPCRSVGGDYFDYVPMAGGQMGILLGDVAGKGLAAALLLAGLQARVHVLAEQCERADQLMAKLNKGISHAWPGNRFMTMFILALNPETGEFSYCNGGHNPPYLMRRDGSVHTLTEGGPVMGILAGAPYRSGSDQLSPGDSILIFTDGASEAENPAGQDLGEPGVLELMKAAKGEGADSLIKFVYKAVQQHLAGAPAADDVTLLALRRL